MIDLTGLNGLISALFGIGGAGAVATLVAAWRNYRSGKIGDDESLVKRLYTELTRKTAEAEAAEKAETEERRLRQGAEERAARYRLQLISEGIVPYDEEEKKNP